ncbi:hypothetical protein JW979_07560, partial [bacterium]|nr:hypothetical protein [candidate division CSSED10-310 bacterium]
MKKPMFAIISFLIISSVEWTFIDQCHAASGRDEEIFHLDGISSPVVVPDRYLRRWDPITVFFNKAVGLSEPGVEIHPDNYIQLTPDHPGVFRWLDAHSLQFQPERPWPALRIYTLRVDGKSFELEVLLTAPTYTHPADKETELEPVQSVLLKFRDPVDPELLANVLMLKMQPIPGVGLNTPIFWDKRNYSIKPLERQTESDEMAYLVNLNNPIPYGYKVTLQFRARDANDEKPDFEVAFSTAEPFRILSFGSETDQYPVSLTGTKYTESQAIKMDAYDRSFRVVFSQPPQEIDVISGMNFLSVTPDVPNLAYELNGNHLKLTGDFDTDVLYHAVLNPDFLTDRRGNPLETSGNCEVSFYFPKLPEYLEWKTGEGFVERFGPQMVPMEGRYEENIDLKIARINPFDRSFWPFPEFPIKVDESRRPPGPGEEMEPFDKGTRSIYPYEISGYISSLSAVHFSGIVNCPLKSISSAAKFGLDLEPYLAEISGKNEPGTYLVGIKRIEENQYRSWMRLQVTDLSITTVEEADAVRFIATSLKESVPVSNALIKVEGIDRYRTWETFVEGRTDSQGMFRWVAPGENQRQVKRISVQKGKDTLVLDAENSPDWFRDNQWHQSAATWLQWTQEELRYRGPSPELRCHIFTDRPVYRPGETVHIKGFLRRLEKGALSIPHETGCIVLFRPDGMEQRLDIDISERGTFHVDYMDKNNPTGDYQVYFEDQNSDRLYGSYFRVDAYRIPRFEVNLNAPQILPLDASCEVTLTARYYAGGKVSGQPVHWQVTQFPLEWTPEKRPDFHYSSSGRFSGYRQFDSQPRMEVKDQTDETGASSITIDPSQEPSLQPRQYIIEATVTGPDNQTVTSVHRIKAVPAFTLGLKIDRFLPEAESINPEIIVVGPDGKLLENKDVTVRLIHRTWHSYLRASDFASGEARYVTDVVEETISEKSIQSESEPARINLGIPRAGVYIVEIEAHDERGRAQVVAVDLYAGGEAPVTWSKPVTDVFDVDTDNDSYSPGDTARMIIKSPFQKAQCLIIVEAPEGNQYHWMKISGGKGTYTLPVKKSYSPKIPVHFVIMRPRISNDSFSGWIKDIGKPVTMASTKWVNVNPEGHRIAISLDYPEKAKPGSVVPVDISLRDPDGNPVSGEVIFWLVDQAVLSLGKERQLDPIPDFLHSPETFISLHDTRNMILGFIPYADIPGGGAGAEQEPDLFDKVTVRKTFVSVPYYNPSIIVGPEGKITVKVKLPDNLTNFALRAKAVSGEDRFGYSTGMMMVRLPVIIQPSLPRFVRPGDSFAVQAIARVIEGAGGPGQAEIKAEGIEVSDANTMSFNWEQDSPTELTFYVNVLQPPLTSEGELSYDSVNISLAAERQTDGSTDGFRVDLPIRDDQKQRISVFSGKLMNTKQESWPGVNEPFRDGSVQRSLRLSTTQSYLALLNGLDFLVAYPYGCTEQRLSATRGWLSMQTFAQKVEIPLNEKQIAEVVNGTLLWLPKVTDDNGLCAYWPGTDGNVTLTAWAVETVLLAQKAGFSIDQQHLDTMLNGLEKSLRSDYKRFIDGEMYSERCWALLALMEAGRYEPGYASELARKAEYLNLESTAQVLRVLVNSGNAVPEVTEELENTIWNKIVFQMYDNKEVYKGLQANALPMNDLILPSEIRALSEAVRAIYLVDPDNPRLDILLEKIISSGSDLGWNSTNATAAALAVLTDFLSRLEVDTGDCTVQISKENNDVVDNIKLLHGFKEWNISDSIPYTLSLTDVSVGNKTVIFKAVNRYLPQSTGASESPI